MTSRRPSKSGRRSPSIRSAQRTGAAPAFVAVGLNRLALLGQVIHDLHAGLYRWRQVMPVDTVARADRSGEPRDRGRSSARRARGGARRTATRRGPMASASWRANRGGRTVSLLLDADGRMLRGRCTCSHHFTGGLRKGPCRHLQALRSAASHIEQGTDPGILVQDVLQLTSPAMGWFRRIVRWLIGRAREHDAGRGPAAAAPRARCAPAEADPYF